MTQVEQLRALALNLDSTLVGEIWFSHLKWENSPSLARYGRGSSSYQSCVTRHSNIYWFKTMVTPILLINVQFWPGSVGMAHLCSIWRQLEQLAD